MRDLQIEFGARDRGDDDDEDGELEAHQNSPLAPMIGKMGSPGSGSISRFL